MESLKQFLKTNGWMIVVVVVAFLITLRFVDPAPPMSITMITGSEDGRYQKVGLRLKAELAKQGLELNLVTSGGSIANLEELTAEDTDVSIGFVQSGVENLFDGDTSGLKGLGSLYYEPVWLFSRRDKLVRLVSDLEGLRVAVGNEGSGTKAVARLMLEASDLIGNSGETGVEVFELGGEEAAAALRDGLVDAAFFVSPADSGLIRSLASDPDLDFLDVRRAEAWEANFPFLSSCRIPAGLLDLAEDVPGSNRTVIAPLATLIVNDRFHPAHTPLILEAAKAVVGGGGLLERPGEFPSDRFVSFPLTSEARYYHKNGPPFLLRFLPFWAASLVDRLIILVIPFMVIIIPLVKIAGPLYRWRTRSKIYRWYRYLRETDRKIRDGKIRGNARSEIKRLEELESELRGVEVPLSYADELYELHIHVTHVLARLIALRDKVDSGDEAQKG